jgi:hypothetical protein
MGARTAETTPQFVIWMTIAGGRRDHGVTLDEAAAAMRNRSGLYESLCGTRFVPASITAPPGPPCLSCHARSQQPVRAGRTTTRKLRRSISRLFAHARLS